MVCKALIGFCANGWPHKDRVPSPLRAYWAYRGELNLSHEGLLLCGQRIVVPAALQIQVLEQLYQGYQGVTKCRQQAKQSVWWPGLSIQVAEYIRNCATCASNQTQCVEPLVPSKLPDLPWQRVAVNFRSHKYLGRGRTHVVHDHSPDAAAPLVYFARHGIPEELVSNSGPQFSSWEFADFVQEQGVRHTTSNPLFPQSNGMAECTVQTVKHLLWSSTILTQLCLPTVRHPLRLATARLNFSLVDSCVRLCRQPLSSVSQRYQNSPVLLVRTSTSSNGSRSTMMHTMQLVCCLLYHGAVCLLA